MSFQQSGFIMMYDATVEKGRRIYVIDDTNVTAEF